MKEKDISAIINQVNDLLFTCNTLLCNSGIMENVERKHGFKLRKIPDKNFKSGFHYAVRYKDPETKKWLDNIKSTETDNFEIAVVFAIENKERIIKEYFENKAKRDSKTDGKAFYQMLDDYYKKDSPYLQDDNVNNKRQIVEKQRLINIGFLNNYIIPYLKENNIKSIQEITNKVYSDFKIYLKNQKKKKGNGKTTDENLTIDTINNCLTALNRILQYHERNELIVKLPYSKGTGNIKKSKEDKAKSLKPRLLPIELLYNIFSSSILHNDKENYLFYHLLAMIGLTTGMRNSEIARIKLEDITYIKSENTFILKAWNNKTDYYNNTETEEYRKIPLHPVVVMYLKLYITETENKRKIVFEKEKELKNKDDIIKKLEAINKTEMTLKTEIEKEENKKRITEESKKQKERLEKRLKRIIETREKLESEIKDIDIIKDWKIKPNDYLFGIPKIDNDTGKIDGYIHPKKFGKAFLQFFSQLKHRERYNKTGNVAETLNISKDELEKERIAGNYSFYSFRHTFNTMCVLHRFNDTDTNRSDAIIDYFMGHKMESGIMENYTHINKVEPKLFVENYGKFVLDVLNKFIFISDDAKEKLKEKRIKKYNKVASENKHLFNDDNTISPDNLSILLEKFLKKEPQNENDPNNDDFFTSI